MTDSKRDSMSDSMKNTDDALWSQFVTEATALLAMAPESMSAEQLDRLEAVSDALIHLAGYVDSRRPSVRSEQDLRLLDELARRNVRKRGRWSRGEEAAPRPAMMSDAERQGVRQRILAGLHARRLRVLEAKAPLVARPLHGGRRVLRPDLLHESELAHCAVVVPELAIAAGAGCELWDVECDTTLDLPAGVPRGPYLALGVTGDSMEPLLHSGDTILVKVEERAVTGTVVVARDPDHGYVVKEVGRLTAEGIELLSVNPEFPALRVPHRPGAVLGTVMLKWCPHAEQR